MKEKLFVPKKSIASKLIASVLSFIMIFNIFAAVLPVSAVAQLSDDLEITEEIVPDVEDIEPLSGSLFTYTINVIGWYGDGTGTGFTLTDLESNEQLDVNFIQESNYWWHVSFESEAAELSLDLQGFANRPTAFGTSFVLTSEFSNVYIFWDDMSSTLYAAPSPDGTIDFTVITEGQNIHLAGTFNSWTPTPMTHHANGGLLELLTPIGEQAVPTRRIYTTTVAAGVGVHEFKMLLGSTGWAGGTNATVTVRPTFEISLTGPTNLIGVGNHTFTAAVAPAPVGTIVWAINPAISGISVVDGVVTIAETVPNDTAFTVTASYGGATAERAVRFFQTQPEVVTLTINYFRHDQNYAR